MQIRSMVVTVMTVALVATALLTGCGTEPGSKEAGRGAGAAAETPEAKPRTAAGQRTATVHQVVRTGDDYRLRSVRAAVPDRAEGQSAFTSEAMRAVAALLAHKPKFPDQMNLWEGACAPGKGVAAVELLEERVTVRLEGWDATTQCDLDEDAAAARDQALAWTVVVNAERELGGRPLPEVVVQVGSGETWEPIVPDEAYLPPGRGR